MALGGVQVAKPAVLLPCTAGDQWLDTVSDDKLRCVALPPQLHRLLHPPASPGGIVIGRVCWLVGSLFRSLRSYARCVFFEK